MLDRSRTIRPRVIDLNLIPLELRQPFITRGMLALAATILAGGVVFLLIDYLRADTWLRTLDVEEQMGITNNLIQKENSRIAAEKTELAKLDQEIKRLKDDIARLAANPVVRTRRTVSLAPAVEAALVNQPAGLRLTTVTWQEPKLILQGRAANVQLVVAYAERMRDAKRFLQVDLRSMAAQTDKDKPAELMFNIELYIAPEGSR